jgi:hypothetical protein
LNDADVFTVIEQMSGKAMTKRLWRYSLLDARLQRRFPADLFLVGYGDVGGVA